MGSYSYHEKLIVYPSFCFESSSFYNTSSHQYYLRQEIYLLGTLVVNREGALDSKANMVIETRLVLKCF